MNDDKYVNATSTEHFTVKQRNMLLNLSTILESNRLSIKHLLSYSFYPYLSKYLPYAQCSCKIAHLPT